MKFKLFILIFLGLLSTAASATTYQCESGLNDLIRFKAIATKNKITVTFNSQQGHDGRFVAGKKVVLKYDPDRGNEQWHYLDGKIPLGKDNIQYIYIELGRDLAQKNKLSGIFAISPPSSAFGPNYFSSMGLNCN